ncbi:MAG TPA: GDP-mannose 4,6-dehydratase [Flavobacteriales bacterium]|nr:GDP-mannose 4,6-dehydratase [Flavobacteriales bacterium]
MLGSTQSNGHALVTGGAGFIGSHLVEKLLASGWRVTALDNFDPFYSEAIKRSNIAQVAKHPMFTLIEGSILDPSVLKQLDDLGHPIDTLIHLAAKAGVRPSIADPMGYHQVNVTGTLLLLEAALRWKVQHFVLASSSSIYGEDADVPWREEVPRHKPISPYAATKLMAESYGRLFSRLHGLKVTALRFFTVFGPRQRPDLAIHDFTRRISNGLPIVRYGDGSTRRDYTFIGDIVNGVVAAAGRTKGELFEVYNLGNSGSVMLRELISAMEHAIGSKAVIEARPEQLGDVPRTQADISKAQDHLGYAPETSLSQGLDEFVTWYRQQRNNGLLQ